MQESLFELMLRLKISALCSLRQNADRKWASVPFAHSLAQNHIRHVLQTQHMGIKARISNGSKYKGLCPGKRLSFYWKAGPVFSADSSSAI
jgi:hypothetical protein